MGKFGGVRKEPQGHDVLGIWSAICSLYSGSWVRGDFSSALEILTRTSMDPGP